MIRKRAVAVMLVSFAFDFDAVVSKHLFKVEPGAERLEVNP